MIPFGSLCPLLSHCRTSPPVCQFELCELKCLVTTRETDPLQRNSDLISLLKGGHVNCIHSCLEENAET